ncbi:MAG: tRNA lysidine(34) synthetase TilS [Candidatus Gastranaerophilales bacterium]|nr:tRNA lysidine(34) synthetase TilS [Candidatus Gastranaerophilales bacterium]
MLETVDKFLDKYDLKHPDKTFLIGFSGGCDSLCLLDILHELSKKYKFKIIALHLNHNWRGEESLRDEINCRKFCEKIGVDFISETLEDGERTESFAREARYNFFLKYAKKNPDSCVFTAHSRTDNAETIVYRLVKGTGINGLQGIPQMRMLEKVPVYRPLLEISRKNIEDYCNSKGLVANTDSSNRDVSYKRNFIRHKIMPLFEEINFHSEKSIAMLAKIAKSYTKIVDEYMELLKKDIYEDKKVITEKFKKLSEETMRKIIYDACLKKNLEYDSKKVDNILEFIKNNFNSKAGSRYSITENLWLFVSSKYIYLITNTKGEENKTEILINKEGEWEFSDGRAFSLKKYTGVEKIEFPSENALFAYVNLADVGLNLTIRTRREGDFITPFGMTGKMKLKKYLNSKGISRHEKNDLLLLCKSNEVLWVAGVGLSNKLRVENKPTHVLEVKSKKQKAKCKK